MSSTTQTCGMTHSIPESEAPFHLLNRQFHAGEVLLDKLQSVLLGLKYFGGIRIRLCDVAFKVEDRCIEVGLGQDAEARVGLILERLT